VDFNSISNYQLDECFDILHLKELASERIPYYPNLVAMFYANLRGRKRPFTLYSLVKGTMITLGKTLMGTIMGISTTGPRIIVRTLQLLIGINPKHSPCFLELG